MFGQIRLFELQYFAHPYFMSSNCSKLSNYIYVVERKGNE